MPTALAGGGDCPAQVDTRFARGADAAAAPASRSTESSIDPAQLSYSSGAYVFSSIAWMSVVIRSPSAS